RPRCFALVWPLPGRDTSACAGGRVDFAASRVSALALVFLHKSPSFY
ncbi:Os12g0177200, partial [Oryza sativa Japonica Group]